jgi:hypothetical protein
MRNKKTSTAALGSVRERPVFRRRGVPGRPFGAERRGWRRSKNAVRLQSKVRVARRKAGATGKNEARFLASLGMAGFA